jgi:hypothetical protein
VERRCVRLGHVGYGGCPCGYRQDSRCCARLSSSAVDEAAETDLRENPLAASALIAKWMLVHRKNLGPVFSLGPPLAAACVRLSSPHGRCTAERRFSHPGSMLQLVRRSRAAAIARSRGHTLGRRCMFSWYSPCFLGMQPMNPLHANSNNCHPEYASMSFTVALSEKGNEMLKQCLRALFGDIMSAGTEHRAA